MSKIILDGHSIDEAITALGQGRTDKVSLVDWLCSKPFPMANLGKLFGHVSAEDFARIAARQGEYVTAAAQATVEGGNQIRPSVAVGGGVSVYGINSRMPVTLGAWQWRRFLQFLGAPADNPIEKFIASKPTRTFSRKELEKYDSNRKLLESAPAHLSINGDTVVASLVLVKPAK